MVRVLNEEQKAKKNEYNRARYASFRAENIELAREKDRIKAQERRAKYREKVNEYDRVRYAERRDEIRAQRAQRYAGNVGGMRDHALRYQQRKYQEQSMTYRLRMALNAARARSVKRGIAFDLTLADLGSPTSCAATGIEFDLSRSFTTGNIFGPSLDRIDPSLGYVKGNVRVVCHGYNLAKHTGTDANVLILARAIVEMADGDNWEPPEDPDARCPM